MFIKKIPSQNTLNQILVEPVKLWIKNVFGEFNNVQKVAIPQIIKHKSTLVMAPTGSGKTLAAFIGIISELLNLEKENKLDQKIYCLYVSPLKALNNDIQKNLEIPLNEIKRNTKTKLSIGKRTGDTPVSERSRMLHKPPHILITTPESLALMLAAPKFKENLRDIKWLIIDEIHSIADNKRGTLLSLCIERLQYYLKSNITRIGLSATVEPIDQVANFMMGNRSDPVGIIDMGKLRKIEVEVITPTKNLVHAPYNLIERRQLEIIKDAMDTHKTLLIFTNTRYLSERLVYKLIDMVNEEYKDKIAVHHGSLDRDVRLLVEEQLKKGNMKVVFSSTSLELGIDIGSIDLTAQLGSPKTVRGFLQRVGRSGHSASLTSRGMILVFDRDDLIESTAIAKLTTNGIVDKIRIPESPLDVLFQILVGMSLEQRWKCEEAYNVIKLSYPYRNLSQQEFNKILEAMANPTNDENSWKYGHIWFDPETMEFGKRKSARQAYMQNIGTIPEIAMVDVILEIFRTRIGQISERFAENLTKTDTFILGGKTYEYLRTVGNKIIVKEAFGVVPTVPSWVGEAQTRSIETSIEIGAMFEQIENFLINNEEEMAYKWLLSNYPIDKDESLSIINYLKEQLLITPLPNMSRFIVESYIEPSGSTNILVLSIYGLETNRALAHGLASIIGEKLNLNLNIIPDDNGFLLRIPPGIEFDNSNLFEYIKDIPLEDLLIKNIYQTELFKLRFRYVAGRSLMILRQLGKNKITLDYQKRQSRWLINSLSKDFPIMRETVREILYDTYNIEMAQQVLDDIKNNIIEIEYIPGSSIPSPMTHQILLNDNLDVVLLEDRKSLLLTLHKQLLNRILPDIGETSILFDNEKIQSFYEKRRKINFLNDEELALKNFIECSMRYNSFDDFSNSCLYYTGIQLKSNFSINYDWMVKLDESGNFTTDEILPFYLATKSQDDILKLNLSKEKITSLRNKINNIPPVLGYEYLIKLLLSYLGPLELPEILKFLKEENNQLVKKAINNLLRTHNILQGAFISNKTQYMLYSDRDEFLKSFQQEGKITEDNIRDFRLKKMRLISSSQSKRMNLIDLFIENGPCRDPIEIMARFPSFKWSNLRTLLTKREVYFGRFLGKRLVFMHKDFLNQFITITRNEKELSSLATEILITLNEYPALSIKEIQKFINQPKSKIQSAINELENELYISRVGWELTLTHGGFPNPKFIALPFIKDYAEKYSNSVQDIICWILKWYGPLTLQDILRITRLPYHTIETELENIMTTISKRTIYSYVYYGYENDFIELENLQLNEINIQGIQLLSPLDPYFYMVSGSFRREQLPRHTILTILKDGKPSGTVELAIPDKDILQVINLQIYKKDMNDNIFVAQIGFKLIDLAKKAFQAHIVNLEEINFKAANHEDNQGVVSTLIESNFVLSRDFLIGSTRPIMTYSLNDIYETRQLNYKKLYEQKYDSIEDLFQSHKIVPANKALNMLKRKVENAKFLLSNASREGKIHYFQDQFYDNFTWQFITIETEEEFYLKELFEQNKIYTYSELLKPFNKDEMTFLKYLNNDIKNQYIEIISPYSRVIEYRLVTKTSNKRINIVNNLIKYLIKVKGPLNFSQLLNQINSFSEISRTELLINLSNLIDEKLLFSGNLMLEDSSQLMYYNSIQREILEDPVRKQEFLKWEIYPKELGIFPFLENDYDDVITYYGLPLYKLKIKKEIDTILIENISIIDNDSINEEDIYFEGITFMENFYLQKGFKGIKIQRINSSYPSFWLNLKQE